MSKSTKSERVVLYARVSSLSQEKKESIRTQIAFADNQGVQLTARYLDDGISGSIPLCERPAGARLWADAIAGKFDRVVVVDLSRLSRNTLDTLTSLQFFNQQGITFRSLTESIDTSTPTGELFVTMLASMHQFARQNIAANSKRGAERTVREGKWPGGKPPFGFMVKEKRLALDPIQSEIVRDIFRWYLREGLRVRAIARRLNAAKIKHPLDWNKDTSRVWWESTISDLLRNPVYIGQWSYRKRTNRRKVHGKEISDKTTKDQQLHVAVPPIVSLEDFALAGTTLTANRSASFRNVKNFYLLRGLIWCRRCGSRYSGCTSGRTPWIKQFYRCRSHISTSQIPLCGAKHVRADILDDLIWQQCVEFAEDPGPLVNEMRAAMMAGQDNQWEFRMQADQLDKAITEGAQQRSRIINLYRRNLIDEEEMERELKAAQAEIDGLRKDRERLKGLLESAETAEYRVLTAESILKSIHERVLDADSETKREVAASWIDRIEIETVGEGRKAKAIAHVRFVFRQKSEAVTSVRPAVATSRARLAACWPRTSRKSTL